MTKHNKPADTPKEIAADKANQQNIQQWLFSDRLYEKYFFFYGLIITLFVIIGLSTLGFELAGMTPVENLILNVLWCGVLTIGMALTPLWFRWGLGRRTTLLQKTATVYQKLSTITDNDSRHQAEKQLANNGGLPPNLWQFTGMVFIGWYVLFEFLIVVALVRDYQLVWEPQWLQAFIEWGIENTKTPADYGTPRSKEITVFYAKFSHFDFFDTPPFSTMNFANELDFLNSPMGHTVITFALWRLIIVPPTLVAFALAFAKMLGWLGVNGLNIKYAKGIVDFLGRVLFNCLTMIFLFSTFYLISLTNSAESMISASAWVNDLSINLIMFIFVLIPSLLIVGWCTMIYEKAIKLKQLLTN